MMKRNGGEDSKSVHEEVIIMVDMKPGRLRSRERRS